MCLLSVTSATVSAVHLISCARSPGCFMCLWLLPAGVTRVGWHRLPLPLISVVDFGVSRPYPSLLSYPAAALQLLYTTSKPHRNLIESHRGKLLASSGAGAGAGADQTAHLPPWGPPPLHPCSTLRTRVPVFHPALP